MKSIFLATGIGIVMTTVCLGATHRSTPPPDQSLQSNQTCVDTMPKKHKHKRRKDTSEPSPTDTFQLSPRLSNHP